jgi:hypothetical protein
MMWAVTLRSNPVERDATLPDGRVVRVRVGLADDSYISPRELDTVTLELIGDGEHLGAVTTILSADQDSEARQLVHEVVVGLENGTLAPTAGAVEALADTLGGP